MAVAGLTQAWNSVVAAHEAKFPGSIFADSLSLTPTGDGNYMASMSIPEGRMEASGAGPTVALETLALDIEGAGSSDERREDIARRQRIAQRRRLQDQLDAIPIDE